MDLKSKARGIREKIKGDKVNEKKDKRSRDNETGHRDI